MDKLAALPKCPEPIQHLWAYFQELHYTRHDYGWGPLPTSYAEIWAWQHLRRITLDPWELEAILKLDSVFLTVMAEAEAKRRK